MLSSRVEQMAIYLKEMGYGSQENQQEDHETDGKEETRPGAVRVTRRLRTSP